jgi:hypothetical protein
MERIGHGFVGAAQMTWRITQTATSVSGTLTVTVVDDNFLKRTLGETAGYLYSAGYPGDASPYFFEDRGSDPGLRRLDEDARAPGHGKLESHYGLERFLPAVHDCIPQQADSGGRSW